MGQNRANKNQIQVARDPRGGWTAPLPAAIYEKAPQEQAAGQTTPPVGDDLALRVLSKKGKLEQEEADPFWSFSETDFTIARTDLLLEYISDKEAENIFSPQSVDESIL